MILGVSPGPAVSVPGQLGVQQEINLEIRTETSNTGLSALREPWDVILEPPEDDPDLAVPVVARPAVVLSELLVALSPLAEDDRTIPGQLVRPPGGHRNQPESRPSRAISNLQRYSVDGSW